MASLNSLLDFSRPLPEFVIIGAQKAGTSSLYQYVIQHPQIVGAHIKELHFFDRHYQKGVKWYRSQFRSMLVQRLKQRATGRLITGEATPYYMFHPLAPRRMKQVVPNAKLIMILRDPVTRAYSQYQMNRRREPDNERYEPLSFEEAINREEERIAPELEKIKADEFYFSVAHECYSYKALGLYADQLTEVLKFYPREQILILKSEEMFADPQQICGQVFRFLDLAPYQLPDVEPHNVGKYDKSRESPTHQQLREFFAPHNQRLYDMIGEDFGW